jgi:hypothetical protein
MNQEYNPSTSQRSHLLQQERQVDWQAWINSDYLQGVATLTLLNYIV